MTPATGQALRWVPRGRRLAPGIAGALLVLLAAGCCGVDRGRGEALEVLVPTAPATLDPRFATDAVGVRVTRLVHAGLVRLDPASLEPLPCAAERWAWETSGALRVELREGLSFASGAPLTPRDVCATLEAFADPALGSPHRVVAASIARCEPLSSFALRLTLREPRATLLTDLEVPILRADEARSAARPAGDLDGLGPYVVAASGAAETRLRARGGGVLPRPARDVVIRVVHDENARALRMLGGQADVAPNSISPTLLASLEQRGVRVSSQPGANLTYVLIDNERPGWQDVRARRAVSLAVDRPQLVRTLLGGRARAAESFLPPRSWAYAAPRAPFGFDPGAARALFAEAGLRRATLLTSTDRLRVTVARAIAQMLGDAGLEVEVTALDLGVLLQRLSSGDFEIAILQIPEFTEPNLLRWFFHSASIPAPGRSGANRARYRSATLDRLLDEASAAPDREARRAGYRGALGQLEDDMPVVPLFHEDQVAALSARAASFRLSAEGRWLDLASVP